MKRVAAVVLVVLTVMAAEAEAQTRNVIIRFRDAAALHDTVAAQKVQGKIRTKHLVIPAIAAEVSEETLDQLRSNPAVAYVEDNVAMSLPSDVQQVGSLEEYAAAWGVARVGARTAAEAGITGKAVKVAVIDSGIDYTHPELQAVYVGGANFIYPGITDTYDDEVNSHGTHVAGIIAAAANASGVVGVAPQVSVYALKVLDATGWGDASLVVQAIEWAIQNKMDIINISSGTFYPSQLLKEACDKAYAAGVVIVAAAGNGGRIIDTYPALYDSVIAVSATRADDTRGSFSNYGTKVELAAPGDAITSTAAGGGYKTLRGTSMAAPHVTGAAALLLSTGSIPKGTSTTGQQIRKVLDALAIDLGAPGRDENFGYGLLDVSNIGKTKVLQFRCDGAEKETVVSMTVPAGGYSFSMFNNGIKKVVITATTLAVSASKQKINLLNDSLSSGTYFFPADATVTVTSSCRSAGDGLLVMKSL